MEYKGYEGLTQAQIKEKIVVEFYTKGTVNGKKSNGVPFKQHLRNMIMTRYNFEKDAAESYAEDLFQLVFENLWRYSPEKFCNSFFIDCEFIPPIFFSSLIQTVKWRGFAGTYRDRNYSLMSNVMWTSSLNPYNQSLDVDQDDEDEFSISRILADPNSLNEDDYSITKFNEINDQLNDNEKAILEHFMTSASGDRTLKTNLQHIQNNTIPVKNGVGRYKTLLKIISIENGTYIKPKPRKEKRDTRGIFVQNGQKLCDELIHSGKMHTVAYTNAIKTIELFKEQDEVERKYSSIALSVKKNLSKHSKDVIEGKKLEMIKLSQRKEEINNELDLITGLNKKERSISVLGVIKKEKSRRVVRITETKEPEVKKLVQPTILYKKLYKSHRYEGGKMHNNSVGNIIADVEQELFNLIQGGNQDDGLFCIAQKMLQLLNEDVALLTTIKHLNFKVVASKKSAPEVLKRMKAEQIELSDKKKVIREELKKLEDDRKRIILSDATNGGNI